MIHYVEGNLFESKAEALVNAVNTVGVMGKGIAMQFKTHFPVNYKVYAKACKQNELEIGKLLVVNDKSELYGEKLIVNFPTKMDWKNPSQYEFIERGLIALVEWITTQQIRSIAVPALGAGLGGLDWREVKLLLEKYLQNIACEVYIYPPINLIKEVLKEATTTNAQPEVEKPDIEGNTLASLCKFCAYQDRSRKEIETKMLALEIPETEFERVIAYLIQEKYFNEMRFVAAFVRGKFKYKQWGRKKILFELKAHGVPTSLIYEVMDDEISDEAYQQTIKALIQKKKQEIKKGTPTEIQAKLARYLLQKGYEWEDFGKELK